ncbi:type VII toxin-antitoxin system HepT family RNase toxin [Thiocapsa rosea]|uniref:Uncharacterized protein YutE (UPF0331/DUF86 family) n=1 Tax=Thiocapsa rosea TaxID=69360 RepID=A0A495V8S2_9GAMM|nr:DUF86 domain-containing protein [Thiocapsa rosea]RKT45033.1 uncharacterized protein YutE (UPF0331/DUF86 family) [Thiocapsa rosea]
MTDQELVEKKLAFIESCIADLRHLARPELIEADLREQRFVAYTLQIAIQAALDAASHIVADERLGEPTNNRALFEALLRDGWLPPHLAPSLAGMVGFRNILVHGYQAVDPAVVRDVVQRHLDDLLQFVAAIRAKLSSLNTSDTTSP